MRWIAHPSGLLHLSHYVQTHHQPHCRLSSVPLRSKVWIPRAQRRQRLPCPVSAALWGLHTRLGPGDKCQWFLSLLETVKQTGIPAVIDMQL